jgi:hypothetical protein
VEAEVQEWLQRADIGRSLSPQEEAAHRARLEAMRREREAEDAKRNVEARRHLRLSALLSARLPQRARRRV